MKQRKYKVNTNLLDKYYTKKEVALKCIDFVNKELKNERLNFLEPAAGNGRFSNQLERCIAVDIAPADVSIIKANFFKLEKDDFNFENDLKICCIGNPPFGRNASLAIKFFNHASKFCDYIAFILPKTFRKFSIQNKLNNNFHIVFDYEIEKNSFEYKVNGKKFQTVDVPSVFQIWKKESFPREIIKPRIDTDLFMFVNQKEADFAVRRVGGRTGKVFDDVNSLSIQSNYFIKAKNIDTQYLKLVINNIDFASVVNNTAGVKSLSKHEFILMVENYIEEHYGSERRRCL